MKNRMIKKMNFLALCCSVIMVLNATAVFSAEDGWTSLEQGSGSGLFQEKCGMCHRPGGMGVGILGRRMSAELALLENREDLDGPFIETVVRNGFGIMFPMSRGEVSDRQLETLIDYLVGED